ECVRVDVLPRRFSLQRVPVMEREEDLPEAVRDVVAAMTDEVAEAALQHSVSLERLAGAEVEIGEQEGEAEVVGMRGGCELHLARRVAHEIDGCEIAGDRHARLAGLRDERLDVGEWMRNGRRGGQSGTGDLLRAVGVIAVGILGDELAEARIALAHQTAARENPAGPEE